MTTTTPMVATHEPVLAVSFELGVSEWKMAFSHGLGQPARNRVVPARDLETVFSEIARAKARFGLPEGTRVVSCYEAGREGFWLHRALRARGIENLVVDSASIEVNRRARRAKTDRLDAGSLVRQLLRWLSGEAKVWSVVRVPTPEQEDRRHLNRALTALKRDRGRLTNRIRGLLYGQGVMAEKIVDLPRLLDSARLWNGEELPPGLKARLKREWERVAVLTREIRDLYAQRRRLLRKGTDVATQCARQLFALRAVGENSSWMLAHEFYSWREFRNRRQIGALAGLVGTPYQSGQERRELGVSGAGSRWVRGMAIELAWMWLRHQPQSELSRWYERRFGQGSKRLRKIGIVALARKLLIELWKYLQTGMPPAGALLKKEFAGA